MIKGLEELNTLIIEAKKQVQEKNEKFVKVKLESMKSSQENEKFCADLESYVQLYNQKSASLIQGINFYSDFARRINVEYQKASDFVIARDTEKNDLIKRIGSGNQPNNYQDSFSEFNLLNPSNNVITNMDYQYQYHPNNQYSFYNNNYQNKDQLSNSTNFPNTFPQIQNYGTSSQNNNQQFNHPSYNPNYNYGPDYNKKK